MQCSIAIFVLCGAAVAASAQSLAGSGAGRSSRPWDFDPRTLPPATSQARSQAPRHRIPLPNPPSEQPRRPAYVGPPMLELRDLSGLRSPAADPRQPLALSPTRSFEGILQTRFSPPSPSIAAGPEDVLLAVNTSIARYTREGLQTDLFTAEQWFAQQIPTICPSGTCSFFDPALHYDQMHGRFLFMLSAADDVRGTSHFMLSVSNGATFASGWRTWVLDGQLNGDVRDTRVTLDFAQMGFDNQAVYLTGDMFNFFQSLLYAKIRILKKTELYNPATTALTYRDFWDLRSEDNSRATSLRPVHLRGQTGEASAPGYVMNASLSPASFLTLWRITNPVSATPQIERFPIGGLWTYDRPLAAAQAGSTRLLDAGDTRLPRVIQRNGVLYTARGTGYIDEPTTVTYDRIDVAARRATLQARIIGGGHFFPAFDVPATLGPGNAVPSLTVVGTNVNAAGQLTFMGIKESKAGEAPFEVSPAASRWGDFFGAALDPVEGGLWTYGEYAKMRLPGEGGRWGTWVSYFPWTSSPQFSDVTSADSIANYVASMSLWQITAGCAANPPRFCPDSALTRGQIAVFLVRAMFGENFTPRTEPFFSDVPATHPFFKYVQKLREAGITTGCAANRFCPDDGVNRGQLAVFLVRGKLASVHGDAFPFPTAAYFDDVTSTNGIFPFVQKLRELGVTTGCAPRRFCADQPVTRGQAAVFLVRAFLN